MRAPRLLSWLAVALVLAGLACALGLDVLADPYGDEAWVTVLWIVATLSSTGVGLVLATRCARNPIGWLLLGNSLVLTSMGLADNFIYYAVLAEPGVVPGGAWAALYSKRAWPLVFAG